MHAFFSIILIGNRAQNKLACDYLHRIIKGPGVTTSMFDMTDARMIWDFLSYSKHADVWKQCLCARPTLMVEMAEILNPFTKIYKSLERMYAQTYFTLLSTRMVSSDWRQVFTQTLMSRGLQVVFLHGAPEDDMLRVLFSVRAPTAFTSNLVGCALSKRFLWSSGAQKNYVPLLPVLSGETLALFMGHVAFARVQTGLTSTAYSVFEDSPMLNVLGLSQARLKLATNFITNRPFQRLMRGIVASQPSSHVEETCKMFAMKLREDGEFLVDLKPRQELQWNRHQTQCNVASCLFQVKNQEVVHSVGAQLQHLSASFPGATLRMHSVSNGQNLRLHVLCMFLEPVQLLGEHGLSNWMRDMSKYLKVCMLLSVTPLDVTSASMNPLILATIKDVYPVPGPERDALFKQMMTYYPTPDILRRPVRTFNFMSQFVIPVRAVSRPSSPLPVSRATSPLPEPCSKTVFPLGEAMKTPDWLGWELGQQYVLRPPLVLGIYNMWLVRRFEMYLAGLRPISQCMAEAGTQLEEYMRSGETAARDATRDALGNGASGLRGLRRVLTSFCDWPTEPELIAEDAQIKRKFGPTQVVDTPEAVRDSKRQKVLELPEDWEKEVEGPLDKAVRELLGAQELLHKLMPDPSVSNFWERIDWGPIVDDLFRVMTCLTDARKELAKLDDYDRAPGTMFFRG